MLALKGYEQSNGFSVLNTDELFYINGGSGSSEQHTVFYDFVYTAVLNAIPYSAGHSEATATKWAKRIAGK